MRNDRSAAEQRHSERGREVSEKATSQSSKRDTGRKPCTLNRFIVCGFGYMVVRPSGSLGFEV